MKKIILSAILFFCMIHGSLALGVASDFLEQNTLTLTEGMSKIYGIRLQNNGPNEVKAKVFYDNRFMNAIDFKDEYIIPPNSKVEILFNITAPKYDKDIEFHSVGYTLHQLSATSGEGVPLLSNINKNFKLKVLQDETKIDINYWKLVYIFIILVIIFMIFKKRKNKPN